PSNEKCYENEHEAWNPGRTTTDDGYGTTVALCFFARSGSGSSVNAHLPICPRVFGFPRISRFNLLPAIKSSHRVKEHQFTRALLIGGHKTVTNSITGPQQFYRLVQGAKA